MVVNMLRARGIRDASALLTFPSAFSRVSGQSVSMHEMHFVYTRQRQARTYILYLHARASSRSSLELPRSFYMCITRLRHSRSPPFSFFLFFFFSFGEISILRRQHLRSCFEFQFNESPCLEMQPERIHEESRGRCAAIRFRAKVAGGF